MNTSTFPINYLKSIWTPKTAFENRPQLNWLQILLVFIFLTFLLILPVYTHYLSIDTYSIEDFYPNAVDLIDGETVDALKQFHIKDTSQLIETEKGTVAIGQIEKQSENNEEESNYLFFGEETFIISDENGNSERVSYSIDSSLNHITNKNELVQELSRLYTIQNRTSIALSFTLVIYLFLFVASAFILFIYAYLLFLMKDFTLSSILTYKEAVNLILNLLGIPTIIALVYGFYQFNVITMLGIQIIGLILFLVVLYKQTKFQE